MASEVYVGRKPTSTYVVAGMHAFNAGGRVVLKARGRTISKAVDVAEILRNKALPNVKLTSVRIGSEDFEVQGRRRKVSFIELTLEKAEAK